MSRMIDRLPWLLLLALVSLALAHCGPKTQTGADRLQPVPLTELGWGDSLDRSTEILAARGWRRLTDRSAGEAHFVFEWPEMESQYMPGVNPYEITLFAREDRLVAARYIRRDVPETLNSYQTGFSKANELSVAWEGPESTATTPTGNKIAEQTLILQNADFLVKNTRTKTTGAEARFAKGLNDELESQIYSISLNEGISVDRLKPLPELSHVD